MIRGLPDETHRALKLSAYANHRSMEAEIRALLAQAMLPVGRQRMGAALRSIAFMADGGFDLLMLRDRRRHDPA
jgi:plasmid stability protein